MEILARLDRKTGLRVMCGWPTCRGELARVAIIENDRRVLCMLDGWKHKARGHWMLNAHSVGRGVKVTRAVRQGDMTTSQLAGRRNPRFREPLPDDKDVNRRAYGLALDNYVVFPGPEGILADCPIPSCGRVNALTASKLRVASL